MSLQSKSPKGISDPPAFYRSAPRHRSAPSLNNDYLPLRQLLLQICDNFLFFYDNFLFFCDNFLFFCDNYLFFCDNYLFFCDNYLLLPATTTFF